MSDELEDDGQEVSSAETPVFDIIKRDAKEEIDRQQNVGDIRQVVVDALVKEEVDRRSGLLVKGYRALLVAKDELDKLKPDFKVHVGGELMEGYTDEQTKKRKAALKKIAKINQALTAAVEKADYNAIAKVQ